MNVATAPCLLMALLLMALLLVTLPARADNETIRPKPGLWKIDSMTALYGHVVPDVPSIIALGPAALQEHIANMLRQNHMRIAEDGTTLMCITAQQIASNVYVNDYGSGCLVSPGRRTGNTLNFQINCGAPKGTGNARVSMLTKSIWTARTHLELSIRGFIQDIDNISTGSWVSSTCPAGM